MKRRTVFTALAAAPLFLRSNISGAALPAVEIFRDPDCGCCKAYVKHLTAAGFNVSVTAATDTSPIRKRFGMPENFAGCHTGIVAGYVVEGHVPASDVLRLLKARPSAIGLSVPGMPVGSPGMEMGNRRDPYEVLLVDRSGGASVFNRYPAT